MREISVEILRALLFLFAIATPGIIHGQVSTSTQNDLETLDISILRQKAQAGDAIAQNEMAWRYFNGSVSGMVDFPEAANWFEKSAAQGNPGAQAMLGIMYLWGYGVQRDNGLANSWCGKSNDRLQQSALAGDPDAETILGRLYQWGCGVKQDSTQARSLFQKAADQGSGWAEDNLGIMYLFGIGGPKDYSMSRTLLEKANAKGVWESQNILGVIYFNGWGVPKDYAQAHAWFQKSAEKGVPEGQVDLANDYFHGWGVKQDYAQARYWYKKAADQGVSDAEKQLADMYSSGLGGPRDESQALAWYQKAAGHGNAIAQTNLGAAYQYGIGVPKDYAQARAWYQKAADQGYAGGQNALGMAYRDGIGGPRDYAQARAWLQKAADQGLGPAKDALGRMSAVPMTQVNCDSNWSPKFDGLTSDPEGMRASIQQKLNELIAQYGGLDGTINEVESETENDRNRDDLSDEQKESLITMNEGIIDILKCRQSMQQAQMAASSVQTPAAEPMPAAATSNSAQPSAPAAPTPVDVRFFPNSDSRPLTDAEMRDLQNSLRWDPESAPLTQGGTARSNLVDDKGRTLGSVLVRWERRAPGSTQATFTIQLQNGTSCFFHSSAELDDAQGFIVVGGPVWAGWLTLNQPSAGETKQAQGRASVNGSQSLSLKPATAYSTLSGCMTPKSAQ